MAGHSRGNADSVNTCETEPRGLSTTLTRAIYRQHYGRQSPAALVIAIREAHQSMMARDKGCQAPHCIPPANGDYRMVRGSSVLMSAGVGRPGSKALRGSKTRTAEIGFRVAMYD